MLFIVLVLLLLAGAVAIFVNGRGAMFIDPQPSYYIVEDEEEPVGRRAFYYPPIYQEMLDNTRNLR